MLKPEDIDKLAQALIALTQEVWVLRDRQTVLEAMLSDAGKLNREQLTQYQPDEKLSEELSAERKQLLEKVLGALNPE